MTASRELKDFGIASSCFVYVLVTDVSHLYGCFSTSFTCQVSRTLPGWHAGEGEGVLPEAVEVLRPERHQAQTSKGAEEKVFQLSSHTFTILTISPPNLPSTYECFLFVLFQQMR